MQIKFLLLKPSHGMAICFKQGNKTARQLWKVQGNTYFLQAQQ